MKRREEREAWRKLSKREEWKIRSKEFNRREESKVWRRSTVEEMKIKEERV